MKLSKNFELWEFVISQTAQRKGINNQPSEKQIKNLKLLCERILQPAREAIGPMHVSSGYRCVVLNEAVGGSPNSAHKDGYAGDIIPVTCSKLKLAQWVARNCEFDQIILEFGTKQEPSWIHLSADPRNRRQVLRILKGTGYQPITL